MVAWKDKNEPKERPVKLGLILSELINREIADEGTRRRIHGYYRDINFSSSIGSYNKSDIEIEKMVDEMGFDDEEEKKYANFKIKSFYKHNALGLPPLDKEVTYKNALDLLCNEFTGSAGMAEDSIEELHKLFSEDHDGALADVRDDIDVSLLALSAGDRTSRANNFNLLKKAISTLILIDRESEATEIPSKHERRIKALTILSKADDILEQAIILDQEKNVGKTPPAPVDFSSSSDDVGDNEMNLDEPMMGLSQGSMDFFNSMHDNAVYERTLGISAILKDLKSLLSPLAKKAQGELMELP